MSKTKRFNLNRNPVYIPNQPSQKGGGKWTYQEDNTGYEEEVQKERRIHMKLSKRKKI